MTRRPLFQTGLCALAVLTLVLVADAQLSGNYTVDPNGSGPTNFTTMSAAIGALGAGVSGPVNFDVKPATYKGLLVVTPVAGVSSVNTVNFVVKGSTPATIDANRGAVGLFMFDGAAWINFTNFKIQNFTKYGLYYFGFSPGPGVHHCVLTRVDVIAPTTSSSSVNAHRLEYSHDNTFVQCKFIGGGYTGYSQQIMRTVFDGCEYDGGGVASRSLVPYNSNDADNVWQNCFIHDCGPTGYAVYMNVSSYGNMMWHNTIIASTSASSVWAGGLTGWSRACSWRNNIIVNTGSGSALKYGCSTTALECNDLDYNCYFAPNTTRGTVELERTLGSFTAGTLAQWQTYLKGNPSIIPGGGGTSWDQNSVEMDPALVSRTKPYDIHLQSASPLVDAGTTLYVAGPWITYNSKATVATDFEGDTRGTLVDIGADEQAVRVAASGSPTPGGTVTFDLTAANDPGLVYQLGASLGNGPIPIGSRLLGLSPDDLLVLSTGGKAPQLFQNYAGVLDANGKAQAKFAIPNIPQLSGVRFYNAFVTLNGSAPQGVQSISNSLLVTIS